MEGNLCFKIDWASLIVGRNFTVFALFYFEFEGNFQVQGPGGLILFWRGNLMEGFLRYESGALILGGAYFRNFMVAQEHHQEKIRVFNTIFMNVQCSDSCSSFGVPAICCYFITRRTSSFQKTYL